MIRKTKPASLLLLLHLMAGPPTRHEHKNDLYSRGLKVILVTVMMAMMTTKMMTIKTMMMATMATMTTMMMATMVTMATMMMAMMGTTQVEESESGGVRLSLRSQELLLGEREVSVIVIVLILILLIIIIIIINIIIIIIIIIIITNHTDHQNNNQVVVLPEGENPRGIEKRLMRTVL